ncbi:PKD-like family lipoprotein [Sphingobacterium faecale]|uniref:PKD family protein n=1 Tax=Sphingobacterium faecale TaxID=2803775 RepID=A0ABS1R5P8_9SPHI|nr:PKD-like family lipoprotein [Sphingobacterium faecale]MBL1409181.1 hypothetical protein [Sphingobacterium faecale]
MKYILKYKAIVLGILLLQTACLKDTGNYDYIQAKPVSIKFESTIFDGIVDEVTEITPLRTYGQNGGSADDYDHEWYVSGDLVSRDSNLVYTGKLPGTHLLTYTMIDKSTGVRVFAANTTLRLASPYQNGWAILYEENGQSELGHIRYDNINKTYITYRDIYSTKHNGESLGSKPIKLKNYPNAGVWSLVVVQQGGQGPIELDSYSMQKALVTREAFAGGSPNNLEAINIGCYPNAHILVNTEGQVFPRLFSSNPIPFSMPWLNIPMQIEKGMHITDLWDAHAMRTYMSFMYDKLNNRLLYINLSTPNSTGGYIDIDTIPSPQASAPYPPDHVNLNNMKDWEYVWGGGFNELPNYGNGITVDGIVLMRKPGESDIFLQSFGMRSVNRVISFTPKQRKLFTGSHLVNENTKYLAVKNKDFIFFTAGADNKALYYYDIITGNAVKLFEKFDSRITALAESDDSLQMSVGLEDGTVILFSISDNALTGNADKELFRMTGLGKIADIITKGGFMR